MEANAKNMDVISSNNEEASSELFACECDKMSKDEMHRELHHLIQTVIIAERNLEYFEEKEKKGEA